MRKPNRTLVELWIGSVVFNLLVLVVSIWFINDKTSWGLGLLIGCITACGLAWHMARSIEKVLDNEAGAQRIMRVSSLLRFGIVFLILIVACYVPYINPIAVFVGTMGLKIAAYIQPLTNKIVSSFCNSEGEV